MRRLPRPRLRKRVASELFAGLNRLPDTPALPGLSGPRSKLSPAKSFGTTGPGCSPSIVIVTGWVPGPAAPSVCPRVVVRIPDRPSDRARVGHDLVIRRHGQVVQDCPGVAVFWTDVP